MNSDCSRRQFIQTMTSGALSVVGLSVLSRCSKIKPLSGYKPNIIFILSDDLSYNDLSCHGQMHFQTPNLDRLALNGIRFTQAYSGAPECAPARGSLMTGMHMGHCRIRKNRSVRGQDHLTAEDVTVAEVLKKAGYATGFIGKWGIGLPGTPGVPYKKGFDYAYGFYDQTRAHTYYPDFIMENERQVVLPDNHGFNMRRVYAYNRTTVDNLAGLENLYDEEGKLLPEGVADPSKAKNSENLFQQAALKFIDRNKDHTFFLYYATQLPHGPCITPDLGAFKDKNWSLKHKEWAAMVSHLDRSIGTILARLQKYHLLEETIIFFAGDNGYSQYGYFGRPRWQNDPFFRNKGPWRGGKSIAYDGGLRVPLFVHWSGHIEPSRSDHICAFYDFLATAGDLAGVQPPDTDGISLVPELEGKRKAQKHHEYLYWENIHEQAVRLGPWHAFRINPAERVELYRIEDDPGCEKNLAAEVPQVVRRIKEIFNKAHVDSDWYINPGESEESIEAKKRRTADLNQLQLPVAANTTFTKY